MKKITCLILSLLLFISFVNASELGHNSSGYERSESNNYGVNKSITITDSNKDNILRTPYVDAKKKIYDFVDILTAEEEKELNSLIDGFIKETNLDFVFVSIDLPYSDEADNEEYAHDFYDYNDFGINNDKYGGIIIIRNTYEQDPYYYVLFKGESQLYCNGSDQDDLIDQLYDYFPNKLYKEGISQFLHSFSNLYSKGYDPEIYYIDENGSLVENKPLNFLPSVISGGIVSLLSTLGLIKKNKMVKKASNANEYLDKSSIQYVKKTDTLVSTITTHHRISSDSSSGGSHSSFGSSGLGGSGGGRHG